MKKSVSAVLASLAVMSFCSSTFAVVPDEPNPAPEKVESVPGEYVVKLKKSTVAALSSENIGRLLGGVVKTRFNSDPDLIVIKKDPGKKGQDVLDQLNANAEVDYAEPNFIYKIQKAPDDPDYPNMWGFHNRGDGVNLYQTGTPGVDINVEKAWDVTTGSGSVVVGIIDTGIDLSHPDLLPNLWTNEKEQNGKPGVDDDGNGFVDDVHGYNFFADNGDPNDDNGHGSHVAGIIGGHGNDGIGIAGINWSVKLMAVKFLSSSGSGSLDGAIKAVDYATAMGVKITNNSWGGGGFSQALADAIKRANDKGSLFVAAAGNASSNNDTTEAYPANIDEPNVLAVASVDNKGALSYFSNYGAKKVAVAAPGEKVWSAYKGSTYKSLSGTSMACPHVAGLAALVLSQESLSVTELKRRIVNSCKPLDSVKDKVACGGIVDSLRALSGKK
jgi:subtilisin family serine protease